MKKISVLVLILIIFNFICSSYMVYAESDPETPTETSDSTSGGSDEKSGSSLSMDEYKSIADEGKTTISGNQKKISLSESDVGSASSRMGTFLSTMAASILRVTSKFTYEGGFLRTESEYSAEKVGFFTINSLIFGEYMVFNAKVTQKSTDIAPGSTPSEVTSIIDNIKQKGAELSNVSVRLTLILATPLLMLSIVRWVSAKKASDLAAWKKILARWVLCIFLVFFYPYILTSLDLIVDSLISSAWNMRVAMEEGGNVSFEVTVIKKLITQMANTGGVTSLAYSFIFVAIVVMQVLFIVKYVIRLFGIIILFIFAPVIIIIHSFNLMLGKESDILGNFFKIYITLDFLPVIHTVFYLIFFFTLSEIAINVPVVGVCILIALYHAVNIVKAMFGLELGNSIFSI